MFLLFFRLGSTPQPEQLEEKIIVEIKAMRGLDNSHLAQVIGYLAVSGCPLGLLITFGERSLRYRRIFPP